MAETPDSEMLLPTNLLQQQAGQQLGLPTPQVQSALPSTGLTSAQIETIDDVSMNFFQRNAIPFSLSIVGATAGGMATLTTGGALGTAAPIAGAVVGNTLGRAANYQLGIQPELTVRDVLKENVWIASGGAAGVLVNKARQFGAMRITQNMNQLGPTIAKEALPVAPTAQAVKRAFNTTALRQSIIHPKNTMNWLKAKIGKLEGTSLPARGDVGGVSTKPSSLPILKRLLQKFQNNNGRVSFETYQEELKRLGARISVFKKPGSVNTGIDDLQGAFKVMQRDLDILAGQAHRGLPTQAAMDLQNARFMFKRRGLVLEVMDIIDEAGKEAPGFGQFIQFNAARAITKIKKNPFFTSDAFSQTERNRILDVIGKLNEIGRLGEASNAPSRIVFGGAMGGLLASRAPFMEAGTGAGIGALAGIVMPRVMTVSETIGIALTLQGGTRLLQEGLRQGNGKLTPAFLSILGAFVDDTVRMFDRPDLGTREQFMQQLQQPLRPPTQPFGQRR